MKTGCKVFPVFGWSLVAIRIINQYPWVFLAYFRLPLINTDTSSEQNEQNSNLTALNDEAFPFRYQREEFDSVRMISLRTVKALPCWLCLSINITDKGINKLYEKYTKPFNPTKLQAKDTSKKRDVIRYQERETMFLGHPFAICCSPSVCRLSVTLVHPTQVVEIFGNISTAFGTLAIRWHPRKILRRSSQGNPSVGGVKHSEWVGFNVPLNTL